MVTKKHKTATRTLIGSPYVRNALWICLVLAALATASALLLRIGTRHGSHRTVPDFTGVPVSVAERQARSEGLRIMVNDSLFVPLYEGGAVLDQLPKPGTEVKAGRKIYVTVNSSRQKSVKVPYVAERSLRQAKNMLESAGLEIERLEYVEDIATNYVLAQFLNGVQITAESNVEAEMGTGVTLRVGMQAGDDNAYIPKLTGLTLSRAKSRLWETGFNVGRISYDAETGRLERANARVYRQSAAPGMAAVAGSAVDLTLTLDAAKIEQSEAAAEAELRRQLEERAWRQRMADSMRMAGLDPDAEDAGADDNYDEDDFFN